MMKEAISCIKIDGLFEKTIALSVVSDLHLDSPLCRLDEFRELMKKRNERFGMCHRIILIGDVVDIIPWRDDRRFRPSQQNRRFACQDDFMESVVAFAVEELKKIGAERIDLIAPGNHEDSALRRYGLDITAELARRLGCKTGAYCGFITYQLGKREFNHHKNFTVVYHHGAWGGRYAKGFIGAKAFFSQLHGWDVAVYGHNHGSVVHKERRLTVCRRGTSIMEETVYYVNCSSWVDSSLGHGYAVIRGHEFQPTGSPLIIAERKRRRVGGGSARELAGIRLTVEV